MRRAYEYRGAAIRRVASAITLSIGIGSCAGMGASMVVKPPLQSECQRLPIRGCGELVDGVLLYVEGDKPAAMEKIREAKTENAPAELKPFAKSLRDAASLPGAGDFAVPMNEIADLLDAPAMASTAAISSAGITREAESAPLPKPVVPAVIQQDPATRALSATADFGRLTTDTVDLSLANAREPCSVAGQDALCVKAREGALIVTDVIAGRSCPDRVFVGATLSDSTAFGFRWQLEATATALTGARLSIGAGERLQVALVPGKKGPSDSPDCFLTWSGFRPWIVPGGIK